MISRATIFLLLNSLSSEPGCGKGCLRCSSSNTCLLCDESLSLFVFEGGCKESKILNCSTYSSDGSCRLCNTAFALDGGACLPVPSANLIERCRIYAKDFSCEGCDPGYQVSLGACKSLPSPVADCQRYSSDGGHCLACGTGVPDLNFKTCVAPPTTFPSCRSFTSFTCTACADGYIIDPNAFLVNIVGGAAATDTGASQGSEAATSAVSGMPGATGLAFNPRRCRRVEVANCLRPAAFNRCLVCSAGYYVLSDGTCRRIPRPQISGCAEYVDAATCGACEQGTYLSDNLCLKVTSVNSCELHSTTVNNLCLRCLKPYYLLENSCVPRENTVDNCQEYHPQADLCQACKTGFVLASTRARCLAAVSFCRDHAAGPSAVVCRGCIAGYYLQTVSSSVTTCVKGTLKNCQIYRSQVECEVCDTGFYTTASRTCAAQSTLLGCSKYSLSSANLCEECQDDSVMFPTANRCVEATSPIADCLVYRDAASCVRCDPTVAYLSAGRCVRGSTPRCAEFSADKDSCVRCRVDKAGGIGLVVGPLGTCVQNNPNLYANCETIEETPNQPCILCRQGSYPRLISTSAKLCVPIDFYLLRGASTLAGCDAFDSAISACVRCTRDENGRFAPINASGACVSSCGSNESISTFYSPSGSLRLDAVFACRPSSEFSSAVGFSARFSIKCTRYDRAATGDSQVCAQCLDGSPSLYNPSVSGGFSMKFAYIPTTSVESYYSPKNRVTPVTSCLSPKLLASDSPLESSAEGTKILKPEGETSNTPSLENCRFVAEAGDSGRFFCAACRFGFASKVVFASNTQQPSMQKCKIMTDCLTDVWINGLGSGPGFLSTSFPVPLDFFLTCHACSNGGSSIPTVGLNSAGLDPPAQGAAPPALATLFGSFGVPAATATISPTAAFSGGVEGSGLTTCRAPGIYGVLATNFPRNCAAQLLRIEKPLSAYTAGPAASAATNPVCLACSPGYKATYASTPQFAVIRCEKIANCASSTTVNACEVCDAGFALRQNASGGECVAIEAENCLITASDSVKCVRCQNGHALSSEGLCDPIELGNCRDGPGHFETAQSLSEALEFGFEGEGCAKCDEGFIAVTFPESAKMCVAPGTKTAPTTAKTEGTSGTTSGTQGTTSNSADSSSSTARTGLSVAVPNCSNFGLDSDGSVVCGRCSVGFTLASGGRLCIAQSTDPNCFLFKQGGGSCLTCLPGYYYDSTNSLCQLGSLPNCLIYADSTQCVQCADGFAAVTLRSGRSACFDLGPARCAEADASSFEGGQLDCLRCQAGFWRSSASENGDFSLRICLKIPPIVNCSQFLKRLYASDSLLECAACVGGFYLSDSVCTSRKVDLSRCVSPSTNSDSCSRCASGHFVDSAGTCQANPTGPVGCLAYTDGDICSSCDAGLFLANGICNPVAAADAVPNCRFYRDASECAQCKPNYVLRANVCEQALAANCLTYSSRQECATCPTGFGFVAAAGIVSCARIVIPSCDEPDPEVFGPDFACRRCATGFFPQGGACVAVSSNGLVSGCMQYLGNGRCARCAAGSAVSSNGNLCVGLGWHPDLDPNCLDPKLVYSCSACSPGFFFGSSSNCQSCPSNGYSTGCEYCNPDDGYKTCSVCVKGYSQNGTRVCDGVDVPLPGTQPIKNNTDTGPTLHAMKLLPSLMVLVVAFLI